MIRGVLKFLRVEGFLVYLEFLRGITEIIGSIRVLSRGI